MRNEKYKILVLSDLKEKSTQTLRYAAKLAHEIGANVEFFYAKKATEVAQTGSQLSAMRLLSEVCNETDKKIKAVVTPISKENRIKIRTTFAFGNVRNEIENYINSAQPDMIILGERKPRKFNLLGDGITNLVQKKYEGVVFVATDENVLDANGNVSLDNLGLKNNIAKYNVKVKNELTA